MRALALLVVLGACGRFGFIGIGDDDVDAASSDGSDATVSCAALYPICDSFEGAGFDSVWTVDPMITLDTSRAHRGASSVHVKMPSIAAGTDSYISITETKTFATPGPFWVRAWFWLGSLPAGTNGMELMVAEQLISGPEGDYVFIFNDSTHLYSQFASSSEITTAAPVGSWFCVVFNVVRSTTTTGSLEMSGDLPPLVLANVVTDDAVSPLGMLAIGMGFSGTNVDVQQPPMDMWIDDVIVHSAPVTCAD